MVKLIIGKKGFGKTKILIDRINEAAASSKGNVICVEKEPKLTYDLAKEVRLVHTDDYDIEGYAAFYGFLTGLLASNYDITHIFVDSTLKICGADYDALETFMDKINDASKDVLITFTISAAPDELASSMQKYV